MSATTGRDDRSPTPTAAAGLRRRTCQDQHACHCRVCLIVVILGHIALTQIKTTGEGGRGLAIAALVIGYASMAIGAYIITGLFSAEGHNG